MNFVLPWTWLRSRLAVQSTRERKEYKAEPTRDIIVLSLMWCFAQNVQPYSKLPMAKDRRKQETEEK